MLLLITTLLLCSLGKGQACGSREAAAVECPEQYTAVGGQCLLFGLDQSRTWADSRTFCQGVGGDLAVLTDCDDFAAVIRAIHLNGLEVPERFSYWVGATDQGDEGVWAWIDGTPMVLGVPFWGQEWDVPEPSGGEVQNCGHMYGDERYFLHDGECDKHAYALCQYGVLAVLDNQGLPYTHSQ